MKIIKAMEVVNITIMISKLEGIHIMVTVECITLIISSNRTTIRTGPYQMNMLAILMQITELVAAMTTIKTTQITMHNRKPTNKVQLTSNNNQRRSRIIYQSSQLHLPMPKTTTSQVQEQG